MQKHKNQAKMHNNLSKKQTNNKNKKMIYEHCFIMILNLELKFQ